MKWGKQTAQRRPSSDSGGDFSGDQTGRGLDGPTAAGSPVAGRGEASAATHPAGGRKKRGGHKRPRAEASTTRLQVRGKGRLLVLLTNPSGASVVIRNSGGVLRWGGVEALPGQAGSCGPSPGWTGASGPRQTAPPSRLG